MKIAVVGANGKEGRLIVAEAKKAGQDVTAVVRSDDQSGADHVLEKDLFDLMPEDVQDFDVVVDAFGAWTPETLPQHSTSLMHLADILSGTQTRLVVVGGAGSLYVNPEHTMQLKDAPDFPEMFKPLANAMGEALEKLRGRSDVEWTYISPAADFQAEGKRTGRYSWGGEELISNAQGKSEISYADFAAALVDEAVNGHHVHERISVVGEE